MMMCWEAHDWISASDHDIATCSIRGAAETAAEAGVKQLVMVHTGGRLTKPESAEANEREARSAWGCELIWGREQMVVPWPK